MSCCGKMYIKIALVLGQWLSQKKTNALRNAFRRLVLKIPESGIRCQSICWSPPRFRKILAKTLAHPVWLVAFNQDDPQPTNFEGACLRQLIIFLFNLKAELATWGGGGGVGCGGKFWKHARRASAHITFAALGSQVGGEGEGQEDGCWSKSM